MKTEIQDFRELNNLLLINKSLSGIDSLIARTEFQIMLTEIIWDQGQHRCEYAKKLLQDKAYLKESQKMNIRVLEFLYEKKRLCLTKMITLN